MPLAFSAFSDFGHWTGAHPESAIAATALLVTVVFWLIDHHRKQRQISYRVHMNAPVGATPDMRGTGDFLVRRKNNDREVADPSLVLIRISNSGQLDIVQDDFSANIQFDFGERQVEGFELFELRPPALGRLLQPAPGTQPARGIEMDENRLSLPKFDFNRGQRFKLLALLSGKGNNEVVGDAQLRGGRLIRDIGGNGPTRRTRRTLAFGGISVLLVGLLVGLFHSSPSSDTNAQCVNGDITVVGSTAFEPAMSEIAQDYEQICPGAAININARGSVAGINATDDLTPSNQSTVAVMYDGAVNWRDYSNIVGKPIAAISFAVVVNRKIGVYNLTVDQLRDIFSGMYTSWRQINASYADLPIDIVGRDSQSGTRNVFKTTVLGGKEEPDETSQNCTTRDPGKTSPPIRCEMDTTPELLKHVNNIPGAIGYAELPVSSMYPNVNRIQIDDHGPDIQQDAQLAYPFRTTEHIYTYGTPADDSTLYTFLTYLNSDKAENVMQKFSAIPCADLAGDHKKLLCG